MKTLVLVFCLVAAPAFAQVEIVAAVKASLVARGVSLAGPCGAFEITKRVAWALRAQGLGLLSKPAGNNCQGYSTDYLVRPDASGIDMLGDSGGENIPSWSDGEAPGVLVGRWREPFDPGDLIPPPVVVVPPPVPSIDLSAQIAALAKQLAEHEQKEAYFRAAVGHEWAKFGKFLAKWGPLVAGLLFAGRMSAE